MASVPDVRRRFFPWAYPPDRYPGFNPEPSRCPPRDDPRIVARRLLRGRSSAPTLRLLETLYPTGAAVSAVQGNLGLASETIASAAAMGDGDDLTYSASSAHGDGLDPETWTARARWGLTAAHTWALLDWVRVRLRVDRDAGVAGSATVRPDVDGTPAGSPAPVPLAFGWLAFDFETDPADGRAWTAAKLNAQRFGYYFDASTANATDTGTLRCAELRVEVWGY